MKNKIKFSIPPRSYVYPSVALTSRYPIGTHVLDKDWDVLVVLDTCRVDAMQEMVSEYSFIGDVDRIWSRGAHSCEWMLQTFNQRRADQLENTALISANPFAEVVLEDKLETTDGPAAKRLNKYGNWDQISSDQLAHVEYAWQYKTDNINSGIKKLKQNGELIGHVTPPEVVTDLAIDFCRNGRDVDRLILHYWQPHKPFVANAISEGRESLYLYETAHFNEYLKETDDWETVYQTYLDELRYALDNIELLLNNIDANDVAISADHGEAMGEFGDYNHQIGLLNPYVRYVPWVETNATDEKTRNPKIRYDDEYDASINEQLAALGYN